MFYSTCLLNSDFLQWMAIDGIPSSKFTTVSIGTKQSVSHDGILTIMFPLLYLKLTWVLTCVLEAKSFTRYLKALFQSLLVQNNIDKRFKFW